MLIMKRGAFAAIGLVLLLGSSLRADLITNGSFESPDTPFITRFTAGTPTGLGWTVGGDGVDLVDMSLWAAQDGNQSIELNRFDSGQISQSLSTTIGTTYEISFYMAGNPDTTSDPGIPGPAIKSMDVSFGATNRSYTFDTTGRTFSDLGFVERTFFATATSSTTIISFDSTSVGYAGIVLDNVSVSAVPEPSSIVLLGFAVTLIAATRQKRQHCHRNQK